MSTQLAGLLPRHLYALPIVGGCAMQPRGTCIAYTVTTLDEASDTYRGSVQTIDIVTEATRVITHGTARDGAPQWSADGTSLIFVSDRSGTGQLWRVSVDGGDPQPLPTLPGRVVEFAVSPVGQRVAAIVRPSTVAEQVERRRWRRITRLRYRADGEGYFDDLPELWLIDIQRGTTRQLTSGDGFVGGPAWRHDGSAIAFTGEHDENADSLFHRELWTASESGDWRPQKLLTFGSAIQSPAWSPDGKHLAFCGIQPPHATNGIKNVRLFAVQSNGDAVRCLTEPEQWTCGNFILTDVGLSGNMKPPQWLSDGALAVIGSSQGSAYVFKVRDGAPAQPVTPSSLSVIEFSMDSADRVVVCASDCMTPPELYTIADGQTKRLTHATTTWTQAIGVQAPEHTQVTSDGNAIDVWHLKGVAREPRACVLQIHGGPHFAYGNAFVFEFLLLAAAGFDVVYCNPRGSQTYGEPFAAAIKGNWGHLAFADCMTSLDAIMQSESIDPQRTGIAGGSYGGYLTGFIIGHTKRFAAAIAMRPVANLASLWGTSEVGRMLAEDFGGPPLEAPDIYERDSVLSYAANIETPLLIIHSDQDYRAPIEQAEQLFTALRVRNAPVEMLRFLGTDHNLSRMGPPSLRVTRLEAILEWFRRFLS